MKKIFFILFLVSVSLIAQPNHLTTRGLISCWDIGNKASYSGSGSTVIDLGKISNATVYNSPTYTTSNWGYFTCVKASSQDFRSGTSSNYVPRTNDFSFGGQFRCTTIPASSNYYVIEASYSASNFYALTVYNTTGYLRADITGSTGTNAAISYPINICDGMWHDAFVTRISGVMYYYVDGNLIGSATCTSDVNITTTNYISSGSMFAYSGDKRYLEGDLTLTCYYNVGLTSMEVAKNHWYLFKRKLPLLPNILFEGNSWFASNPLPSKIVAQLAIDTISCINHNYSVGSAAITYTNGTNYMSYPSRLASAQGLYNYGRPNIVVWFEGINDIYYRLGVTTLAASVSGTYTAYVAYADSMRRCGFINVFNTLTPRQNTGTPANYETARQNASNKLDTTTINGLLRRDFTVTTVYPRILKSNLSKWKNCYLLDIGDDPNMGQAGQCTNLTYYQSDFVHPSTTGQDTVTQYYYAPCINGILKGRFFFEEGYIYNRQAMFIPYIYGKN